MKFINVTYLVEVCGGSKDVIKEMSDIFIEQVPEFYSEMKQLLDKKNYFDLGLLAHKAKSSVAIMGMENLAVLLKELELKSKAGEDIESYKDYIDKFYTETEKAIIELKDYINNI